MQLMLREEGRGMATSQGTAAPTKCALKEVGMLPAYTVASIDRFRKC